MACYRPLVGYKPAGGGRLRFTVGGPPTDGAYTPVQLKCGQCIGCRVDRSREWAARCVHEAQLHDDNSFITLTYNDAHLPPDEGLNVKHWQKFAKRLRKRKGPFRFFTVGEYGSEKLRPHYHAIIFGMHFADRKKFKKRNGHWIYTSEELDDIWKMGYTSVGDVSYSSAAYVARYCMKKITGPEAKDCYERVDMITGEVHSVKPEFSIMSRGGRSGKGGIGAEWLKVNKRDVYPNDEVVIEGRRMRPPRFYDKNIPESELEDLKVQRRKRVAARRKELTPERLRVKERVQTRRAEKFRRHL